MDVVLQSRPPEHGPGQFHPKAASGHGCITVLLLWSVEIGRITLQVVELGQIALQLRQIFVSQPLKLGPMNWATA